MNDITPLTLRQAREKHDPPLTQEQLEAKSGVNQATISAIELGKVKNPASNTVKKLEEALEIPRGSLTFESAGDQQSRLPLKRKAS